MFRPSREPQGEDPRLMWRVAFFLGGAAFGVAGMVTEISTLTWIGVGLLGVGLLIRFLSPKRRDS